MVYQSTNLPIYQSSEGLIVDLWYKDDGIDSIGLSYSDADDECDKVDLITPAWARTIASTDGRGTYYKWQRQVELEGFNNCSVRTFLNLPANGEMSLSSLHFDSESAAINAVINEDFGTFDVCNASIVKVTSQFVSNPCINTEEF